MSYRTKAIACAALVAVAGAHAPAIEAAGEAGVKRLRTGGIYCQRGEHLVALMNKSRELDRRQYAKLIGRVRDEGLCDVAPTPVPLRVIGERDDIGGELDVLRIRFEGDEVPPMYVIRRHLLEHADGFATGSGGLGDHGIE